MQLRRIPLLATSLALAAGPLLVPARAVPAAGAVPRSVAPASAGLAAALETVQADHLAADERFIAADELAGRDTPSPGLRVAARFVRARLERLDWRPGARDGYFQTYRLDEGRIDAEASRLVLERDGRSVVLQAGRDYVLRSLLDLGDADAAGGVVWCGDGREEDFEHAALEGRWALCRESGEHPRVVRNRARSGGAVGVLLVRAADQQPFERRYEDIWSALERGRLRFLEGEPDDKPVYPLTLLGDGGLAQLLELAGTDLAQLAPGAELPVTVGETRRRAAPIEVENVCGFWPGSDPALAGETVIVSAHYDHLGTHGGEIYNGADDNGSGTCGLLALAEALASEGPLRRSVLLIWVSGEEKGLWGSRAWVDAGSWLPDGGRAICDINIDMIGRNAPNGLLVTPSRDRPEDYNGLVRLVEELGPTEGFTKLGSADAYYHRSDQAMFARLGIPVTFLFADVHEDYHRPTDTADKLDYDKMRRVVRLVLRMIDRLQADKLDL
jgi:Peptidase family M28